MERYEKFVSMERYANPPIPYGYKYVEGEWNNGFVIERCKDGSQFVWIPARSLEPNGTLEGVVFSDRFGRRDYNWDLFLSDEFDEHITSELKAQRDSVMKYGGFYISRYNISINEKTGKPQSVKGVMPWVNVACCDAKKAAKYWDEPDKVAAHLVFGSEYDSVLQWFEETNARTKEEISMDSSSWGNFETKENKPGKLMETGSNEKWCTNNIYDFAGNVSEWTQETYNESQYVYRGGNYSSISRLYPVSIRLWAYPDYKDKAIGFRIALCI